MKATTKTRLAKLEADMGLGEKGQPIILQLVWVSPDGTKKDGEQIVIPPVPAKRRRG